MKYVWIVFNTGHENDYDACPEIVAIFDTHKEALAYVQGLEQAPGVGIDIQQWPVRGGQ